MLRTYLEAFGVTLAVEVPIYVATLTLAAGISWRRAALAAVGVNVVTHPMLWWTLHEWPVPLLAAEAVVCLVEWALLVVWVSRGDTGRDWPRIGVLAAASLAANAASTLVGLALFG